MTINSFSTMTISRLGGVLFVMGKVLRFFFFLFFLMILVRHTRSLAGYNASQVVLFFLTFNTIDMVSQFFFREVYRFRQLIVSGNFDLVLVKPINPLFRSLLGGADLFDLTTAIPLVLATLILAAKIASSLLNFLAYLVLLGSGFVVATTFHIFVLALGILTTEIDHAILIYRDVTATGRVPIDIYAEPVRSLLTFVLPVGIMITLPVKALIGLTTPIGLVLSLTVAIIFLLASLRFWHYALTQYASASS